MVNINNKMRDIKAQTFSPFSRYPERKRYMIGEEAAMAGSSSLIPRSAGSCKGGCFL
jgi:hypothetical protein